MTVTDTAQTAQVRKHLIFFTTAQVRAEQVSHGDVIDLASVTFHRPSHATGGRIDWTCVSPTGTSAPDFRYVYSSDEDGTEGDVRDNFRNVLHDQFALLRISVDTPDASDFPDEFIAVLRHELVTVQTTVSAVR